MRCRHHPTCPGCPLLDLPYEAQLARKRDRLVRALSVFPYLGLPVPSAIQGSAWTEGYRHRLKLPVHHGRGRVATGLYDREGRRVLDTPDCPVLAPELRTALGPITQFLRGKPDVHSIDLRVSRATGELQLVLAVHGGDFSARSARDLMRTVPGLVSVAASRADPEGKRVMGSAPRLVAGELHLPENIGQASYRLQPGAFFQVDPRQAELLHRLVVEAAGDASSILDLYAGVGAYALALAPGRKRVVAVEEVPQAAEAARAAAPANVQVITSKVEDYRPDGPFDLVILNPARRGSDPESLARVAALAPRLIYVSCGPESLARDLDILAAHGMRTRALHPVDLFPHTAEVETVAVLERGKPVVTWEVPGGRAGGPWLGKPGGALGTPKTALALVIGDTGPGGSLPGARFTRLGIVATHSLVRLELAGNLVRALSALASRGHPVAGRDFKTRRFFTEKAGLVREFVHVERSDRTRAPLHGDLALALLALGAPPDRVRELTYQPASSA
jgi:23S rRNA (uracil1939-C5)-methyltransferase